MFLFNIEKLENVWKLRCVHSGGLVDVDREVVGSIVT